MIKLEEQGRSMVEMLGVLAVMGVLSVSGVAMYTSAMNKHRANELLNAVSVRATALASQRMTGKALSLAGFTDNTQGTSVIDVNSSNAGAIEITISNVPLSVCKNMYNTRGANVIEMKSGTTVLNGAGACEEGATVSIKFNNDLSSGNGSSGNSGTNQQQEPVATCPADFDTHNGCQSCENGVVSYAAEGTSCAVDNRSACDGRGVCNACPPNSFAFASGSYIELTNTIGCRCPITLPIWDGTSCQPGGSNN